MYCCFWEEQKKKTKPEINKNNSNNKNHIKQEKTQTKEKSPVISRHIYLNVDNKRKLTSNIPYKLLLTAPCWSSAHHRGCLVPLLTSTSLPCLGEHKLPEQKYSILCTSRPMLKNCVVGDPRTSTTSPQPQLFLCCFSSQNFSTPCCVEGVATAAWPSLGGEPCTVLSLLLRKWPCARFGSFFCPVGNRQHLKTSVGTGE